MKARKRINIIIVGGGLAGLTNAVLLQKAGYEVSVFEKKKYPFHRVCGEYVSNETLSLLASMDIHVLDHGVSCIEELAISTASGAALNCELDLGGFGLSRFRLDYLFYERAMAEGVKFIFEKVTDIRFADNKFQVQAVRLHETDLVISCHGKRSNMDQKLVRRFFYDRSPFMGVKYHIKTDLPRNLIRLDTFPGGYAGTCKIEAELYNLCYLTKTHNLKQAGSVKELERTFLSLNPYLKEILQNSDFISTEPEVINEISFAPKTLIDDHILYCGDSAGMITPLCGNGMAMAMHSAKILSDQIIRNSTDREIDRSRLENAYQTEWNRCFRSRLKRGRLIQSIFGNKYIADFAVRGLQHLPAIRKKLIAGTHGNEILRSNN